MKKILTIAFWALSIFFCYMIYKSVMEPIEFNKTKSNRYTEVIRKLKDIRDAQEAYRVVNGKYASNFDELVNFVENGKFTITSQRDTSWIEFNRTFNIDELKQGVVIDTLGYQSVKDSLFKNSDRYKTLNEVILKSGGEEKKINVTMKSGTVEKNGYEVSVFEASVPKAEVLWDQSAEQIINEEERNSVEDVKGKEIKVGSLEDVSTNGNWPTLYDARTARK
ncbi:MAG: hypothetical protein Q4G08_06480 [Capnocytophaga sp.]|nr:hypothetical protein [Capnocytophaga sp.]